MGWQIAEGARADAICYMLSCNVCKTMHLIMHEQCHTGRERLIRSHSLARFCFELSGNSN